VPGLLQTLNVLWRRSGHSKGPPPRVSFAENKGERALPQRGVASTSSLRFYAMTVVRITVAAAAVTATTTVVTAATVGAELQLHAR
jgi:hypothetical protein